MREFIERVTAGGRSRFVKALSAAPTVPSFGEEGHAEKAVQKTVAVLHALSTFAPVIVLGLLALAHPVAAMAQAPGGSIFGASDQTIGNGFKAFCKYFRVIIFFVGFVFMGLVGICKGVGKPWGGFLTGGLICWGFAGLAQLGYSFATGNEVEITPDID